MGAALEKVDAHRETLGSEDRVDAQFHVLD
jgi:hypothetical protein